MSASASAALIVLAASNAASAQQQQPQSAAPQAAPAKAPVAKPPGEDAKKQKEAEAAKRAYEAGLKSYQAGKYEPAIQSLNAALRGGGLSSQDMAKGLYTRGLAYKKQNKPGLAISDLTSALWLKNGLNDADRATATAERADAYRLAGISDGSSALETAAVPDPNVGRNAAPAAAANSSTPPAPVPVTEAAAPASAAAPAAPAKKRDIVDTTGGLPTPFSDEPAAVPQARQQAAAVVAPAADGPIDQAAQLEQSRVVPSAPAAKPVVVPAPIPEGAGAETSNGSGNTVSSFFSNLFGNGASAEKPADEPAPAAAAATQQEPTPATSSWTNAAPAAPAAKAQVVKPVQTAALPTAPAAAPTQPQVSAATAPAPKIKGGKYKVHVAAMRSRADAEGLAQKLLQQHGAQMNSRAPVVDEAVIGSMGTFYRVRVGTYATADEPRGLCNALRNSGYDCLVVTN